MALICTRATAGRKLRQLADRVNPPRPQRHTLFGLARHAGLDDVTPCEEECRQAALSLLDEHTVLGFVLVQVRRDQRDGVEVTFDMSVDDSHQAAVNATLARILLQSEHA